MIMRWFYFCLPEFKILKDSITVDINQTPEQIACDRIDKMLREAGWIVKI